MRMIDIGGVKSSLSRLAAAIESGQESEIIITRNGKPAARIIALEDVPAGKRLAIASGKFVPPEPSDALDQEIAKLFNGA